MNATILLLLLLTVIAICIGLIIHFKRKLQILEAENEQLREEANGVAEADALRRIFISKISHELRNPLAIIQLSVEMIREFGKGTGSMEKDLGNIATAAKMMTGLFDAVSVYGKLEDGSFRLRSKEMDVVACCREAISGVIENLERSGEVTFNSDDEFVAVNSDPEVLKHMVGILVKNAVLYSRGGDGVVVAFAGGSSTVEISVKDEGMGIPEEDRKHLFDPYYRGSNIENAPGLGLGLAVVKKYVDLLGGTISVDSEVGQGCEVVVKFPV